MVTLQFKDCIYTDKVLHCQCKTLLLLCGEETNNQSVENSQKYDIRSQICKIAIISLSLFLIIGVLLHYRNEK